MSVVVHRQAYVCRPAEAWRHPSHETSRQRMLRTWWTMRSLVWARHTLAARCPAVAAGRAMESLVIRDAEFTVEHRPVALRVYLAACDTCPPTPEEPDLTSPREHEPIHYYTGDDEPGVNIPAEVCATCSDFDAGRLVPASFCPASAALMGREP
jgi:hypothetical protein